MPNFEFSDEEKQLVETAREFARKEIVPVAGELDEHGTFPGDICKKAWETGLMNCELPEAFGGLGLSCLAHCLVPEEISYGCTGVNTTMAANMLGTMPIIIAGTDEVKVDKAAIVGPEGEGFKVAMRTFDRTRPWIAAGAAGIIRRALEESRKYALERKTFGTPIAQHQAIQFMLADMAIAYEATRLLCHKAAAGVDSGKPDSIVSSYAKAYSADAAM